MKYALLLKKRPPEMADWQDCQWRRVPCGRDACPICGPIKECRADLIAQGEDPDSPESVFKLAAQNLAKVMALACKNAEKMSIDPDNMDDTPEAEPPVAKTYPLYIRITNWRQGIYDLAEASDEVSSAWLYTEAGRDLLWYANTITAKIARQLRTIWRMERQGEEFLDWEYAYTGFVLGEVTDIMVQALKDLSLSDSPHAAKFNIALINFTAIVEEIKAYETANQTFSHS